MSDLLRIGLVQMNSRLDKSENLAVAERLIEEAARQGAELVALPEYVNFLGPRELHEANAEPIPGPTTERFAALARRYGIYLLGGSILERSAIPASTTTRVFFSRPTARSSPVTARSISSTSISPVT
jgi:predicted amidohydrolase